MKKLLMIFLCLFCALPLFAQEKIFPLSAEETQKLKQREGLALYELDSYDGNVISLIGMVSNGNLVRLDGVQDPTSQIDFTPPEATRQFELKNFVKDSNFFAYANAQMVGEFTYDSRVYPGCITLSAKVIAKSNPQKITKGVLANRNDLGLAQMSMVPDESEKAIGLGQKKYLLEKYKPKGVTPSDFLFSINKIQISKSDGLLLVLVQAGDAEKVDPNCPKEKSDLGSCDVFDHRWVLLIEPKAKKIIFENYYTGVSDGNPTNSGYIGTDITFLGNIDIDGDGVAELVWKVLGYESKDYQIWKLKEGSWKLVFVGGGYGC